MQSDVGLIRTFYVLFVCVNAYIKYHFLCVLFIGVFSSAVRMVSGDS